MEALLQHSSSSNITVNCPDCASCGSDPCGRTTIPSESALRFNKGKVDYTLIPPDAEEAEARVWMAGMAKYGRNNWEKLWGDDTILVVLASTRRHMAAIQRGEYRDPETGELHAAHIRCNAAMLIRYALQQESK